MKLQGDDSCMGEKHRPLPAEEKKSLRGSRQVRSAQKGMGMMGGPGKGGKVTVHKQLLQIRMSGKREHAQVIFFDEIFPYQYSFDYRRIENNG